MTEEQVSMKFFKTFEVGSADTDGAQILLQRDLKLLLLFP